MTMPVTFRSVAALALAAGLFLALPGCGGSKPQADKGENKDKDKDKKGDPNTGTPKVDPGTGSPKVETPKPEIFDLSSGVGKDAVDFLQAVKAGTAKADQLSTGFVKLIGLPAELPSDRRRGIAPTRPRGG